MGLAVEELFELILRQPLPAAQGLCTSSHTCLNAIPPADRTFSYRPFKATVRTLSKYILPAVIMLDLLANVHRTRLQIENAASPVAAVFILPAKAESVPERMEVPARLFPVQSGDTDKDTMEPGTCCTTH